jgi:hypothetical protein
MLNTTVTTSSVDEGIALQYKVSVGQMWDEMLLTKDEDAARVYIRLSRRRQLFYQLSQVYLESHLR